MTESNEEIKEDKAKPEVKESDGTLENGFDENAIKALVDKQVMEKVKEAKDALDKAYASRDEALGKLAEIERERKEAEIKRLEEDGKMAEAAEARLAEERTAREIAEKKVIQLSRDVSVRNHMAGLNFRNEKAAEMAFSEITHELIQNSQGNWVHRSGKSIEDFVKEYAESADHSFLFKPAVSTGSGTGSPSSKSTASPAKSVFDMTQEEVIQLAREGKLRK